MMSQKSRVCIYVDGFNFYYGGLKGTPYRWLNVDAFFSLIFPNYDICQIRYFTALVTPDPANPDQRIRQQTYLRALETLPNLSIHLGRFARNVKRRRLASTPIGLSPQTANVIEDEEKGSDVNLASHLLVDGFAGAYDIAIVVSNDSDLAEPIRLVRQRLNLQVELLNPRKRVAFDLQGQADFYRNVRRGPLRASQFPSTFTDRNGVITKPISW